MTVDFKHSELEVWRTEQNIQIVPKLEIPHTPSYLIFLCDRVLSD